MDKNTVIGILLIFGIIVGFSWFTRPSEEQIKEQQRLRDSILNVEAQKAQANLARQMLEELRADSLKAQIADSVIFGNFSAASRGENQTVFLENEKVRLGFSTLGGQVSFAQLKEYQAHDSLPLMLFDKNENRLNFTLLSANNRVLNTEELFFTPEIKTTDSAQILTMRLNVDSARYLEFSYTLKNDDYKLDFAISAHNLETELDRKLSSLEMLWEGKIRQQEKGRKFESRYATLTYKFAAADVETLSESKDDERKPSGKLKWIAFKDQFFSTILIAENAFASSTLESKIEAENSGYLKSYKAETAVPFDVSGSTPTRLTYLFVPNKYATLSGYDETLGDDLQLKKLIPLGWSLFRWVNQFIIIPIFNFLGKYLTNYGLIIFLLTLIVKIIILPFTFKSYISTAKMRVLKPQIDEINARFPADKMMERQQATMNLYKRVGVSPMSGCLPMLLQMPILFAMFTFFPACIELRGESFLWAKDLSSYDAILSWDAYIPLITPYFGNHISLFCLLMTISNIIYTKINMASNSSSEQMPLMKWMMYFMPIMFLFIFNDYASGLSYYYFISLLITILQTYLFRFFIDENRLLQKLEENKKKPVKKSGFLARLEETARQRQKEMQKQARRR